MLIAELDGERVEASQAVRGSDFQCPNCRSVVTLKQGRIVTPHFSHKPDSECRWGLGETPAHRDGKLFLLNAFRDRGLKSEIEYPIESMIGDRRADVVVWSSRGIAVAIELQQSSISLSLIEARAASYARAGFPQVWIPFIRPALWERAVPRGQGHFTIPQCPVRPYERWVSGCQTNGMFWMYDPRSKMFWWAKLHDLLLEKPESVYYVDGEEIISGGYEYKSKRWMRLKLWGPVQASDLRIISGKEISSRASRDPRMYWPSGRYADLEPTEAAIANVRKS